MQTHDDIFSLIGKTPLIRLKTGIQKDGPKVFVKLESFNAISSVKDRMALNIIKKALSDHNDSEGNYIVVRALAQKNDYFDVNQYNNKGTIDADSFHRARLISRTEGISGGGSSGTVAVAIEQVASKLGPESLIVGIFADSGIRYLNKCYNDNWMRQQGYLSPQ